METETTGMALALPKGTEIVDLFRNGSQMDAILGRIEAEARSQAADVSTATGRKAIASLAYQIARSKTALDDAGKALNEAARAQINAVDAERRKVRDRLDALKDEVRAPLTAWEEAEASRVAAIKLRIARIQEAANFPTTTGTAALCADLIARIEAVALDDSFAEFLADAGKAKDATLASLRRTHADLIEREAQAAELARLRAEAEAREAERQKQEAERAEAERLARIEREKQEAAERAAREAEARAKAEAERAAKEAAEREAALQRQLAAAKAREEAAAQAERDRIEAARRAEEAAQAKRAADAAHRARVQAAIAEALEGFMPMGAMGVADALIGGAVPHVKVTL